MGLAIALLGIAGVILHDCGGHWLFHTAGLIAIYIGGTMNRHTNWREG